MKRAELPVCDSCEKPTHKLVVIGGVYWRRPSGRVPFMACLPCARRLRAGPEAFDGLTGLELDDGLTAETPAPDGLTGAEVLVDAGGAA